MKKGKKGDRQVSNRFSRFFLLFYICTMKTRIRLTQARKKKTAFTRTHHIYANIQIDRQPQAKKTWRESTIMTLIETSSNEMYVHACTPTYHQRIQAIAALWSQSMTCMLFSLSHVSSSFFFFFFLITYIQGKLYLTRGILKGFQRLYSLCTHDVCSLIYFSRLCYCLFFRSAVFFLFSHYFYSC